MRVLLVSHYYAEHRGGVEIVADSPYDPKGERMRL